MKSKKSFNGPQELVDLDIVSGRYVHPMQPLSDRNRHVPRVMRPGAFDYRDIPSRCANVAVQFKSSIKLENDQE